jgi:hypothetical protein
LGTLEEGGNLSRANGINAYGQWSVLSAENPDLVYGRAFILNALDRSGMIDLASPNLRIRGDLMCKLFIFNGGI